jgi:UDP-glucose 4-epimerase
MKNILVTGGGGYVGTILVKELLKDNYKVTVLDTFWFGNYLKKHKKLKIIKKDLRNIIKKDLNKIDSIIHLASIANDPAAELDTRLTWDVNVLATYKLINLAINQKVKKFIFASSGSVYGIKKEKKVTENLTLEPISEYNKSKMIVERVLLSYKKKIDLTEKKLVFSGKSDGKEYELDFEFFKGIEVEGSIYNTLPSSVQMKLNKKEKDEEFWPRLLLDKVKEKTNVKIDWDR